MSEESKSWYLMSRPLFNSGYEDDEFYAFGIDGFNEVLYSFLGEQVEVYDKCIYKEPMRVTAIVQNVTSDVVTNSYIRQILCNVGILKCGQYIKIGGAYWVVSSLPDNNGIYEKAVLWKCKYMIRFISPITGEIVEYPTYSLNSTQYGTGELNKTNISIGEAQHLLYVPYNEETIAIDNRFRFLMDRNRNSPTAFRITQVDTTSYATGPENEDGLIQWSIIETQYNELTDNKELMVAGYYQFEAGDITSDSASGQYLHLIDEDGDGRLAIGESKRIGVSIVSDDGMTADALPYSVSVSQNDNVVTVLDVTDTGFTLSAQKDYSAVGREIVVTVTCEDIEAESSIEILIVNW